jgi:glycosyltransferase involved in cell wall biosynthesis
VKILQVIDKLAVGGAEKVLVNLSNLLNENNKDVTILCLLEPSVLESQINDSIPIIYLGRKNKYNPITFFKLIKILLKFDCIHIHCRQVLRYVGLIYFIPSVFRPFKVIFHDHYGNIAIDKEVDRLIGYQLKKIDSYIGVSEELVDWYRNYISSNKNTFLLENIVRISLNNKQKAKKNNIINLVMVGNFRPQKNYEFALNLLAILPSNVKLTIIGKIVDISYFSTLKNKIYLLKDRVKIKCEIDSVAKELVNYDLALHTAISETGPLVALEYLASGLPFLIYKTGQVAKTINNELPDFLISDYDCVNWKKKIKFLIDNSDTYSPIMQQIFKEQYSEKKYLSKCLKIYNIK